MATVKCGVQKLLRRHWCESFKFLTACKSYIGLVVVQSYYNCLLLACWSYTVWVKKIPPPPEGSWHFSFFHKRLRIFNRFFTHLLYVPIYARLQIYIQLSPILTKLCHINRDYPVHIICSKCSPSAETHALTHLRKSLTALLFVVCGK